MANTDCDCLFIVISSIYTSFLYIHIYVASFEGIANTVAIVETSDDELIVLDDITTNINLWNPDDLRINSETAGLEPRRISSSSSSSSSATSSSSSSSSTSASAAGDRAVSKRGALKLFSSGDVISNYYLTFRMSYLGMSGQPSNVIYVIIKYQLALLSICKYMA